MDVYVSDYGNTGYFSGAESEALKLYKQEVMEDLYPGMQAKIKEVENIKMNVEGAVLLATTEPKLVETLTTLLTKYGGDISELLEFIPK